MVTLAWTLHRDAKSMVVPMRAGASNAERRAPGLSSVALALCLGLSQACESERSVPAPGRDDLVEGQARAERAVSVGATVVGLEPYPLDGLSRELDARRLTCPEVELVDHAGREVAFSPAARVAQPFVSRLLQLEHVVRAAATQVYGRPPSKILIAASYGCRSVGGDNQRLSEHALGNAIDIAGFVFDMSPSWPDTPTPLPGVFEVRIERHFRSEGDPAIERHARFLDALTRGLVERRVFRTLLGPSHPDHADHFHFDMAPWDYVHL